MKNLLALTLILASAFSASAMKKKPHHNLQHNCIYVTSMDHRLFCFKSDHDVAGATINVYNFKTDALVISDTIQAKNMAVDFSSMEPGDYIIMITKGDFSRRYVFERR
jgi:hypothetical protein